MKCLKKVNKKLTEKNLYIKKTIFDLDKTLNCIHGEILDNRMVFRTSGPWTKHFERLFLDVQ